MRLALPEVRSAPRSRVLSVATAYLLLAILALAVYASPEAVLSIVAFALGALFLVTHPHWGVLAIFVLAMFRLDPARIGPLSAAELLAIGLLVPLALELIRDRRIWVWRVPQVRVLLGIACVLVVATFWSLLVHEAPPPSHLDQTWREQFFFAQHFLFLIYFLYFVKTPRHLVYAALVLLLVIVAAAADGLGLLHGNFGVPGARAGTTFFEGRAGNPNRLGFLCVWGTALLWMLRFKGPAGWWRPMTVPPLFALPVTTLMTGSRSAVILLTILGALIVLDQRRWSPAQMVRALAMMITVAVVILIAVPSQMMLRVSNFDTAGGTTSRIVTLKTGLEMFVENPLFGVGPGNFRWRNAALSGHGNSPHNAYLWALTTGGPLLLILYIAVLYRSHRMLRAVEHGGPARFVWLATALRFNLIILVVGSGFATLWGEEPFFLLVGMTIVLARIAAASQGGAQSVVTVGR